MFLVLVCLAERGAVSLSFCVRPRPEADDGLPRGAAVASAYRLSTLGQERALTTGGYAAPYRKVASDPRNEAFELGGRHERWNDVFL